MHVLLTNDDGPLNDMHSPYVKFLVDAIEKDTDWDLSICVPHTQRSWIGKAHFAGKDLTASFIYPVNNGNAYQGPFPEPQPHLSSKYKEWALIDGTPASCADIGINHLYKNTKGPVDLVISGPNFGRNTSSVYITSSGTVGAAMEASLVGKKAISLSFGFESRELNAEITKEASKIGVELIRYLYNHWDETVDLYSVNIPLVKNLKYGETKINFVPVLQNRWFTLFEKHESKITTKDYNEADIIDVSSVNEIKFKWKPDFHVVHQSVLASKEAGEVNDGVVLLNGEISITPLKAAFQSLPISGEIKLPPK